MTSVEKRIDRLLKRKRQKIYLDDYLEALTIRPHIAEVYHEVLDDIEAGKHSIYNLPGGRGSAKSSFIGLAITKGVMDDPTGQTNAIIFRAVGETLRDSVYAQILWSIDQLGATDLWECTVSPLQCKFLPTGAVILFRGLDDPRKLKSIKPRQGFFRYIWFEEFCELFGEGFSRSVVQSVMRGKGPKPFVFRSFNPPISANNWANQAIAKPDKRALTVHTDYTMIPPEWLGDAFLEEAEHLKRTNPRAFEHEYMGKAIGSGGEVFPNLEIREIKQSEIDEMGYIYQGQDFGFAVDPACFIRLAYDRKHETIYLIDEIYKRGISNAALSKEIKSRGYDQWEVVCDSAEPKSITDLRDNGIHARSCYKAPGCVEYRIKWLQHRKIVIDPARTPNAHREFTAYSYPADKNGNLLSQLVDKDNHAIDATAYGLTRVIFSRQYSA